MYLHLHTDYLTKEIEFYIDDFSDIESLRQKVQELVVIPTDNQLLYLYEKHSYEKIYIPENIVYINNFFVNGDHIFAKRLNEYDFDPDLEAIG
jgi:hypothetical protein